MGDHVQAQCAAAREHARELLGRVAQLAAVQAHADDAVQERHGLLQRGKGVVLAQVAQEAQDQRRRDALLGTRIGAGAVQAVDHRLHRHAARGVRLRVEEDLRVHHVVHGRPGKVGVGHVVEILLVQQHAGARVVDVQEALQVGEGVGAAQLLHAGIGQRDAVAPGQGEDHPGFERAFDVDVQLGLGAGGQQVGQAFGGNGGQLDHQRTPEVMPPARRRRRQADDALTAARRNTL